MSPHEMNICAIKAFVTYSSWSWTAVEAADKERNNFWPTSVISEQMVRTAIRFHKQFTLLDIDDFCARGHLRTRRGHQANNINETKVWRQAFSNRHSMVTLLKRCTTFSIWNFLPTRKVLNTCNLKLLPLKSFNFVWLPFSMMVCPCF